MPLANMAVEIIFSRPALDMHLTIGVRAFEVTRLRMLAFEVMFEILLAVGSVVALRTVMLALT